MNNANGALKCNGCGQIEDIESKIVAILAFYKGDHESAYWAIRNEVIGNKDPLTGPHSGITY